jgi:hypothetical protein
MNTRNWHITAHTGKVNISGAFRATAKENRISQHANEQLGSKDAFFSR